MENFGELDAATAALPERAGKLKETIMRKWAEKFLFRVQQFAPKKTGKYAQSWKITAVTEAYAEVATDNPKLFLILEYGTHPYKISRKEAKALSIFTREGVIFRVSANHPGIEPRPHAITAFEDTERDMFDIVAEALREVYPEFWRV